MLWAYGWNERFGTFIINFYYVNALMDTTGPPETLKASFAHSGKGWEEARERIYICRGLAVSPGWIRGLVYSIYFDTSDL